MIALTRIASGESIWGSCSKKDRLLKNQLSSKFEKIAHPQALSIEYLVFSSFSVKFSYYIV
jgi:hypothetical protein